jgi:hypothetical protein
MVASVPLSVVNTMFFPEMVLMVPTGWVAGFAAAAGALCFAPLAKAIGVPARIPGALLNPTQTLTTINLKRQRRPFSCHSMDDSCNLTRTTNL